jgi:Zinc carboxypeptidase
MILGNSADWAKAVGRIKYSYTIELPDKGKYGFTLPAKFIKPTGKDSIEILKAVVDQLLAGQKNENIFNKNK